MLKRILATALAAAMIFGLASVAFAGPFSDTAGTANEKAVVKLASLGLLKGYSDGTFKPLGNITRAEFAAVVVRALGYESSAKLLTNAPLFSDCAGAQWAWGYINVATSQSIIKGYPDGTFKPNANVTVAEAVTMLVRALGYENKAIGSWPAGHILVASTLGMLPSDLAGVDVSATRGVVAQLVTNVLDEAIVKWNPEKLDVEPVAPPTSFVARNDSSMIKAWTVKDVDLTDNEVTLSKTGLTDQTKAFTSGVMFAGATSLSALKGQKVDVVLNEDDEVIYIGSTDTTGITGTVTAVDLVNKTVTVGGKVYTVRDAAVAYYNGGPLLGDAVYKITDLKGSIIMMVLDSDGKVTYFEATKLDKEGVISAKETLYGGVNKVSASGTNPLTSAEVLSTAKLVRNGAACTWADFKVGDSIKYAVDNLAKVTYIDAYAVTVNGVLQEVVSTNNHVTYKLNDVTYKVAVDSNGLDSYEHPVAVLMPGAAVTITLNRDGVITKMDFQTATTGTVVTIASKTEAVDSEGDTVRRLTLSDGTLATLDSVSCAVYRNYAMLDFAALKTGDSVLLTTNSSGKVTQIKAFASVSGYVYRASGLATDPFLITSDGDAPGVWQYPPTEVRGYITVGDNYGARPNFSSIMDDGIQTVVTSGYLFPTGATIKITGWNLTSDKQYASFIVRRYTNTTRTVKGVSTIGTDTLLVLNSKSTTEYLKITSDAIIHRSDAVISASTIVIGDKVSFYASGGSGASTNPWTVSFMYVSADTSAPSFDTDGHTGLVVEAPHAEVLYPGKVFVNLSEDCLYTFNVYNASGDLVYKQEDTLTPWSPISRDSHQAVVWDGTSTTSVTVSSGSTVTMVVRFKDYTGNTTTPYAVQTTKP
jgi:hypothetical protein